MLGLIVRDKDNKITWRSKWNVSHQGAGETTSDLLSVIDTDDSVTCAVYAKGKNKREKKVLCMVSHAKLCSYNTTPKYKYGFEVPRDYRQAWQNSISTKVHEVDDYDTFNDIGHRPKAKPPPGYKRICLNLVFNVKHNNTRHKARLVHLANGHLTNISIDSA